MDFNTLAKDLANDKILSKKHRKINNLTLVMLPIIGLCSELNKNIAYFGSIFILILFINAIYCMVKVFLYYKKSKVLYKE